MVGDLVDVGHDRGAAPTGREIDDVGELDGAGRGGIREVDRRRAIGRRRHDVRAVLADEQVLDGMVQGQDGRRLQPEIDSALAQQAQVDRRQPSVLVADDQLAAAAVDRERGGARRGHRRDQGAGGEVVRADLGPGRDVEPLTGSATRLELVDPPGLDRGRHHRHAQVARGADVVLAPQDQPAGHRVLGQVRMGPFVDVVRDAVPPRLEELRGRPGVIDLVEVHLVGLGQPVSAQDHGPDDQDHDDPQIELVEPAAALAAQQGAAVGPERRLAQAGPEPADDPELIEAGARGPGRERGGRGGGRDDRGGDEGTRRGNGRRRRDRGG